MTFNRVLNILFVITLIASVFQMTKPQPSIFAQNGDDEACNALIVDALQLVGTACIEMGRDEACYGHNAIDVTLQEDVTASFEASGDLISVADVVSLVTQAADPEAGTWGIAFVAVQADLPDDSDKSVTFVLLGDVNLSLDETFEDESTQAFVLESRENEICEDAPDGMLIQSPEGERARIVVNGVELEMSSAVFLTAEADDGMGIQGLDGQIDVTSDSQTVGLTAGFLTTVPLDGLAADGEPAAPEPIPPGDEFPIDIQTTLLAVSGGEASSASAGTATGLGQTYRDDLATFSYPDGWLVLGFSSTNPYILFTNNPDYLNAVLDDPTVQQPSGTFVGRIDEWQYYDALSDVSGASGEEIVMSYAASAISIEIPLAEPSTVLIGDYAVAKYAYYYSPTGPDRQYLMYGFGDYVIAIQSVGDFAGFEPQLEEMIATFE